MRNDGQPLVHLIANVAGVDGLSDIVQVQVIISRMTGAKASDMQEKIINSSDDTLRNVESEATAAKKKATDQDFESGTTPYIHSVTTSLSEANKQGIDNLAYWRNGPEASKVYIYNQALSHYLAQYEDSQRPIPP